MAPAATILIFRIYVDHGLIPGASSSAYAVGPAPYFWYTSIVDDQPRTFTITEPGTGGKDMQSLKIDVR